MADHIRWGVLGAANFAREQMAPAIHAASGAKLAALATSSAEKAEGFRAFQPDLQVFDDYDALLASGDVDAVYIPLPNHLHKEWALKALDAGKHVLVEKPLGLKAEDFDPVIEKRDATGLLAAEAYMIVHHPQFIRARQLLQEGAIGTLKHVEVAFSYNNRDGGNIRNRPETGGGGLPDIGVYAFGAARYVSGAEPREITLANLEFENDVDTYAQVAADFGAFSYTGMVSMRLFPRQRVTFHGDEGVMELTCPFNANVFGEARLELATEANAVTTERWPGVNHYVLQVENFGRAIRGEIDYPCPLEFSRGTQTMIDMVYAKAGR